MHTNQILKREEASIFSLFLAKEDFSYKKIDGFSSQLLRLYRLIKRLPFNLTKQIKFIFSKKEKKADFISREVSNVIRFEISAEKMNELLVQRQICAADIRCLDINSKQCLKKLCLKTCLYNAKHCKQSPHILD
ncbi:MAG: hypothetical protein L3J59_13980 [Methylococcaceae bacterium]|nr:hypothetical protein [Methylococcaceae bacterium]